MDSLQFKAYASGDDYIKEEEEKFQKASDAVKRIEGANRYETALALSEQWDVSDYAVLASGEDFPDAMFGGPLATQVDAPMLLTKKAALYPGILPRLEALGVKTVYLLGGEEAVSPAVMDTLQEAGYRVVRVGGKNRMETAERSSELAAELRGDEAVNDKIRFEVNRNAYADALAGGAFVAMHREKFGSSYFVPYVGKDGSIVFGGTEVVPSIPNEIRLAGNNRYATAVEIAKAYKTMLDKEIKRVVLVNGENFPDGLAATPFAFRKDAVVL
ncbi:MAG: cell wall-binding repeat-containing protein, partial [Bacillota bacterium]|nr:cell wall-binding repeat-containing protein [Bacillota bacterium]